MLLPYIVTLSVVIFVVLHDTTNISFRGTYQAKCGKIEKYLSPPKVTILKSKSPKLRYAVNDIIADVSRLTKMAPSDTKNCIYYSNLKR